VAAFRRDAGEAVVVRINMGDSGVTISGSVDAGQPEAAYVKVIQHNAASTIELDAGAIAPFLASDPDYAQFADDTQAQAIENDPVAGSARYCRPPLPKTGDNRRSCHAAAAPGPQRTLERLTAAKSTGLPV